MSQQPSHVSLDKHGAIISHYTSVSAGGGNSSIEESSHSICKNISNTNS